uniref:Uncharacterized protein n=1 Tax=Brassica oleracea var. oleracea TaxID=109376 RepID=A0A0D3DKE4_BRAOL
MQRRNQLDSSELTSSDLRMYNGLRYRLPHTLIQAFTSSPSLLPLSRIKAELASSNVAPHINGVSNVEDATRHRDDSLEERTQALKNAAGSKSSGSSLDDDDVCDWGFVVRKKRRVDEVYPSGGEGSSCTELARVILKLGEVYERIEGAKQRMMVELEKHRMEVAKEIELQRMNMLMDMQMELERSKLAKRRTAASELPTDFRAIHVLP